MNKKIIALIVALGLLLVSTILIYKNSPNQPPYFKGPTGYLGEAENYEELGTDILKQDIEYNNIKYTKNHLSTTDKEKYATFTSVVYNETKKLIKSQPIIIEFYSAAGKLLGTMDSQIENLEPGQSTVIFGITETNLEESNSFVVKEVK